MCHALLYRPWVHHIFLVFSSRSHAHGHYLHLTRQSLRIIRVFIYCLLHVFSLDARDCSCSFQEDMHAYLFALFVRSFLVGPVSTKHVHFQPYTNCFVEHHQVRLAVIRKVGMKTETSRGRIGWQTQKRRGAKKKNPGLQCEGISRSANGFQPRPAQWNASYNEKDSIGSRQLQPASVAPRRSVRK